MTQTATTTTSSERRDLRALQLVHHSPKIVCGVHGFIALDGPAAKSIGEATLDRLLAGSLVWYYHTGNEWGYAITEAGFARLEQAGVA